MNYIGNLDYWDKKFKDRGNKVLNPEPTLVAHVSLLKLGSVLDIACGDGRNSIYLLEQGFEVTGIDFSCIALEKLKRVSDEKKLKVKVNKMDLSMKNSLDELGKFDNIIINHYKLSESQLLKLHEHINDDGILFICGFSEEQVCNEKIKENDLIYKSEINKLNSCFELVKEIKAENTNSKLITYIFKKKLTSS
ncbi:class I SAM-dependent methyltransferase [Paraclostridium bifermentans]|uniref:class I SAM-dependent methyltransferase n=1 Tax=Paraclostridium bifermentans TaxID=1490 RepID=UPI002432ED7D|nr:methyltransferase domain-containing protein [Paraclostridium bifermentans]